MEINDLQFKIVRICGSKMWQVISERERRKVNRINRVDNL